MHRGEKQGIRKGRTNVLNQYGKLIKGNWIVTMPIVCNDGNIKSVRIEEYLGGFYAFLTQLDGTEVTNHWGYATSKKAINAAAKW